MNEGPLKTNLLVGNTISMGIFMTEKKLMMFFFHFWAFLKLSKMHYFQFLGPFQIIYNTVFRHIKEFIGLLKLGP